MVHWHCEWNCHRTVFIEKDGELVCIQCGGKAIDTPECECLGEDIMRDTHEDKINICTERDDWLDEQDKTTWICYLDNGLTVFQDDYRPNVVPYSAWTRLKSYCRTNEVDIKRMEIRFRSNCKLVGEDADGYFFTHCAGSWLGQNTIHYFIVGCIKEGSLRTVKWRVPELLEDEVEIRDIRMSEECLILNKNLTVEDFMRENTIVDMEEEKSPYQITSVNW